MIILEQFLWMKFDLENITWISYPHTKLKVLIREQFLENKKILFIFFVIQKILETNPFTFLETFESPIMHYKGGPECAGLKKQYWDNVESFYISFHCFVLLKYLQ